MFESQKRINNRKTYLESIYISQSILHMRINDEFRKSQDFTTQMKSITKTRLLTLLRCQRLHRFQIKVIIQMQVVQIFTVNQQIQHVITLTTNLQTGFNPIDLCALKKLCRFERFKQITFLHRFRWSMMQCIQHKVFQ